MNNSTVFVLGAGFTRAFCPRAPLLRWDMSLFIKELKLKYKKFQNVMNILNSLESDKLNRINIEELLSRLYSGMPYDGIYLSDGDRKVLYDDIFNYFLDTLKRVEVDAKEESTLLSFAKFVIEQDITCITFNYDSLLDQAFYEYRVRPKPGEKYWHPDGGYSFYCKPADYLTTFGKDSYKDDIPCWLLKLHGSLNWRIKKGFQKPFPLDSLIHKETWCEPSTFISKEDISIHLESDPFVIPPVLDKSVLSEQPILRVIWENAFTKLLKADTVIFIGYSLPKTDIAATFLFKEALKEKKKKVIVVNIKRNMKEKQSSYQEVIPTLTASQFNFEGSLNWIKSNCKI